MHTSSRTSIQRSFRVIQGVVALLLVFLVVQAVLLRRVCNEGTEATRGLETEALPSLRHLASLQENLAIYRLRSYELMFAQEEQRAAKSREADEINAKNTELLSELEKLYPSGEGRQRVGRLRASLEDYVQDMTRIRALLDQDFAGAMKLLDQEIPHKVEQLSVAAEAVKAYGTQVASEQTGLTVKSFDHIQQAAMWLGSLSLVFAILTVGLVTWNSVRVRRALTALVHQLTDSSEQFIDSAAIVTSSSQSLAEGASSQAASLEETSASLEEIASMTRNNAENARKASELAREAREAADLGATDMEAMAAAMNEIKDSSDGIAKIIKTIDEIAFQTNILALNAAVEAARAGEAGMGFAVVADEVRSLAQRSAKAAQETADKIEGAIAKTTQGVSINAKVASALNDILARTRQVDELVGEVAAASKEQSQGISHVNTAVAEMEKVTQSNAASAEESASAAQELNAQTDALRQVATELQHLVGGLAQAAQYAKNSHLAAPAPLSSSRPEAEAPKVADRGATTARSAQPASVGVASQARIPMDGDFSDF